MLGTVLRLLFSFLLLLALFTLFVVVVTFSLLVLLFAMRVTHLLTGREILSYAAVVFMLFVLLLMLAGRCGAENSVFFGELWGRWEISY